MATPSWTTISEIGYINPQGAGGFTMIRIMKEIEPPAFAAVML